MFSQVIGVVLLLAGVNCQGGVSYTINSDGSAALAAKVPVAASDTNMLSVLGTQTSTGVLSKGLALDNT
jgi:hypothetical protein